MTVSLTVFFVSLFLLYLFLINKAYILSEVPEKDCSDKYFRDFAKKTISSTRDDLLRRVQSLVQLFLSFFRKIILRIEQKTTKWLYYLKKKQKEKDLKDNE